MSDILKRNNKFDIAKWKTTLKQGASPCGHMFQEAQNRYPQYDLLDDRYANALGNLFRRLVKPSVGNPSEGEFSEILDALVFELEKCDFVDIETGIDPAEIKDMQWALNEIHEGRFSALSGDHVAVYGCKVLGNGDDEDAVRNAAAVSAGVRPERICVFYMGQIP